MITLNTNAESQTASKQQEMPEVLFIFPLFILLASRILLPRLKYNQKLTADRAKKVRYGGPKQLLSRSVEFLSVRCTVLKFTCSIKVYIIHTHDLQGRWSTFCA